MLRLLCVATAVWIAALTGAVSAQSTAAGPAPAGGAKVRIGVFDSRMVALAYYNTDEHRTFVQGLSAQLQAARSANEAAKVAELEFRGPALQNLMHYQVFSSASIPNVLEKLAPVLPKVAADARVSIIVSKWDVAFHDPSVEYVDVTDALVARFAPDEKVKKWIDSGRTKEPMPLVEAVMTLRPDR